MIADAFDLQQRDITQLHRLQFAPSDLADTQRPIFLVQLAQDGPVPSIMRFTLVDVEVYLPGEAQPSTYTRRVMWLPNFATKLTLFRLLHLDQHCIDTPERCHLFMNDFEIEQRADATIDITHGHYISIYIGACYNLLDQMLQEFDDEEMTNLLQYTQISGPTKFEGSFQRLRTDQPDAPAGLDPWCSITSPAQRARPTFAGLTPPWSTDLVRAFLRDAFIEMEEEGPVAYIITWLVQQTRQPHCLRPRTVKLGQQPAEWEQLIREAWEDSLLPGTDCHFHHVQPQPIRATLQTILGHVIVEQEARPGDTVALATLHRSTTESVHLNQLALAMSRLTSRHGFLQKIPTSLLDPDLQPLCRVHLNDIPFGLFDLEEVVPGTHLEVYLPSYRPSPPNAQPRFIYIEEPTDQMQMMQQPRHNRPPQPQGIASNIQSDGSQLCITTTTLPFQFNLEAQEFAMPRPSILSQSEFVQELYESWQTSATSWEGEVRSCAVAAWYVNHRWPRPYGLFYRRVHLFENFHTWEDSLRAAWSDYIDHTTEVAFFLVYPSPPSSTNDIAAHVILVQHEHPLWVTTLVSVLDDDQQTEEPEMQIAATIHEHILFENVLVVTELVDRCMGHAATHTCQMWHRGTQLHWGQPYPGRNGMSIQAHIQAIQRPVPMNQGMNLLQTYARLTKGNIATQAEQERLTDESVAHTHRPCRSIAAVRIFPGRPETLLLPDFVEVERPVTTAKIKSELLHWGYDSAIELLEDYGIAFIFDQQNPPIDHCGVFLSVQHDKIFGPLYHRAQEQPPAEIEDMKFLYTQGHPKAVITTTIGSFFDTSINLFHESQGVLEEAQGKHRHPPPWPAPQPMASNRPMFQSLVADKSNCHSGNKINIGKTSDDILNFFQSSQFQLHTNFDDLELSDDLFFFLNSLPLLEDQIPDRYIIYVDGSSQGHQQHHPTAWIEECGIPDAWAMIILAECYAKPSQPHALFLVGWTAQQVRYDETSNFHLGATTTGSLTAEREGMTWALLWRIGQNNMIPTLIRSDSQLTCDQASGQKGTKILDASFLCLRGAYQLLETALPRDHIMLEHIYGHCGEPFNDFTDLIAKKEAQNSFFLPRPKIDMHDWKHKLPHLWLLFAQPLGGPQLHDGFFHAPVPSLPAQQKSDDQDVMTRSPSLRHIKIHLSLCTANVLSMYNHPEGYSGKVGYLAEQFQSHGLLLGGIQEARTPEGVCRCQKVLRFCSGAVRGQGGVELWVNLQQPYGYVGHKALFLKQEHVQVIHSDSQRLLAKIATDFLHFNILVAHAPHSGYTLTHRTDWWIHTTEIIQNCCGANKPYVLIDANAEAGFADGHTVVRHGGPDSKSTPLWRQFLEEHQLALPQTLPLHTGGLDTWISPDGLSSHCLDYIAIPSEQMTCCTHSQLLETLDLGNDLHDHTPVAIELAWDFHINGNATNSRSSIPAFDRHKIRHTDMQTFLENFPTMDWALDVDTQIQTINKAIHSDLSRLCPLKKQKPKKSFISDELWNCRAVKLRCRRDLKQTRHLLRREMLAATFYAWRTVRGQFPSSDFGLQWQYRTSLLCGTLRCLATFRHHAKLLKKGLKTAKQQGIADHISQLPTTASASTILHTLRPLVGSSNLKNKGLAPLPQVLDLHDQPCTSPEAALNRWIEFFGNMEGGSRRPAQQQREIWIQNLAALASTPVEVSLEELPSLAELETAFRQVTTGKATGPDCIPAEACNTCPTALAKHVYPLLLKTLLHGHEPLLHKGGRLVPIWKRKLSKQRCEAYRSILISSHIGKCIHRTLRIHQASIYEKYLVRQQIEGQRKAPVTLGVHLARAYFRYQKLQQRSSAFIFLDLSEAFYRVIRPLAVGGATDDETLASVAARLGLPSTILEDLRRHLDEAPATHSAQLPRHLQRALQALHLDTHWHIGTQQDACCTTIGTRPGDAFADVIFGYLWSRVLQGFQQEADVAGAVFDAFPSEDGPKLFRRLPVAESAHIKFLGPCWMDDLSIALSAEHGDTLLRKVRNTTSLLIDHCLSHAMQPNLAAGKTEIMLAFQGKGAKRNKIDHYGPLAPKQLTVVGEYDTYKVQLVGQYQHLGCVLHHCGDLRKEIRRRVAIAHKAFSDHRKVLFHNSLIAFPKKVEIFTTLVLSKFLYGTESWVIDDRKTKEQLHGALLRLFRRLLRLRPDQHLSDDQVLAQTGLSSPSELLRIQRLRYFGTLLACTHLVDWGVLNQDSAWLELLEDDFRWMFFQLEGTTHLGDPKHHIEAWIAVARDHRSYWRRLVRRAGMHACKQRAREQALVTFHEGVLQHLQQTGFSFTSSNPGPAELPAPRHWGCMLCKLSFRSKGGEGAHMAKMHNYVNPVRTLFQHTQCPHCLKQYHTATKLKAHLLRATICRQSLVGSRTRMLPIPGTGSTEELDLICQHDRLLPPLQAAGPKCEPTVLRDFDTADRDLHDACCLAIVETEDHNELELAIRDIINARAISWTLCTATLRSVRATIRVHCHEESIGRFGESFLLQIVDRLLQPEAWPFLTTGTPPKDSRGLHSLEEQLLTAAVPEDWDIPRQFGKYRIVLHAFSGRRRLGDFQYFLDALLANQQSGIVVMTVSLDIIVDKEKGNIADAQVRQFWFHSIAQGWTIAFLAGPPCETWSKARAVQTDHGHRAQPRVLRDAQELWGFPHLRLRELDQVCIGNLLLCFAAEAFLRLATTGGIAAIEHPKEPEEPALASIWRLPLFEMLRGLPGVELLALSQGLLGAKSMKPTQLLCLNLPGMVKGIIANQVTKSNPKHSSIGRQSDGHWATGGLKEYPPAFNKALAEQFFHEICVVPISVQQDPDPEFLSVCTAMTVTSFTDIYGRDYAG